MIEAIRKKIEASNPFQQLTAAMTSLLPGSPIQLQGISGSLMAFAAVHLFELRNTQILLVVADRDHAEQLCDDCATLLGDDRVRLYVSGPGHNAKNLDMSATIAQMETLRSLSSSKHIIIVASAEALTTKLPPIKQFINHAIELEVNKEYPFDELIQKLMTMSFLKKDFVEEYGDFAVRGGILDIFPFVGDNPIRFEFWGDTIESIREFDVLSQRSIRELKAAYVITNLSNDYKGETNLSQSTDSAAEKETRVSVFKYLSSDALLLFDEPVLIEKEIEELQEEGYSNIFNWKMIEESTNGFARFDHIAIQNPQSKIRIDFHSYSQPQIAGSIKRLVGQIQKFSNQGNMVYLACDTKEEGERLDELIEEELTVPDESAVVARKTEDILNLWKDVENDENQNGNNIYTITQPQIFISEPHIPPADNLSLQITYQHLPEALHSGFIYSPAKIAIFTEHEIFGRLKRRGTAKRKMFKGFTQKELQQLKRGDFVVHQDYGIGQFAGLQKIKVRGVEAEVIKLIYEENDALYVHLNFVNRVQKYSSQEGHTPKLNKLGGADWDRLKLRARKKIKDIARDLIKLYARRRASAGLCICIRYTLAERNGSFVYL